MPSQANVTDGMVAFKKNQGSSFAPLNKISWPFTSLVFELKSALFPYIAFVHISEMYVCPHRDVCLITKTFLALRTIKVQEKCTLFSSLLNFNPPELDWDNTA